MMRKPLAARLLLGLLLLTGLVLGWYPQFNSTASGRAIYCLHEVQFGQLTAQQRDELVKEAYDLGTVQARWMDLPLYLGVVVMLVSGTLLTLIRKSEPNQ